MAKITLNNVSLNFTVLTDKYRTLKDFLVRGLFRRSQERKIRVSALKNVSLELNQGDRLGIVGHNGAGKSTLLKVLAGIYPPSKGERIVAGRISSLFDIYLGFEPNANAWENMRFRCYLQGETPRTVEKKMQEIAEFSELGEALDMPVRCFSAGMVVRLAFSIATAIDPEILLVDEVLAAGDIQFQRKARQRMLEMMSRAQLMVMVSHDLQALRETCDRILWLDQGEARQIGSSDEVLSAYHSQMSSHPSTAA